MAYRFLGLSTPPSTPSNCPVQSCTEQSHGILQLPFDFVSACTQNCASRTNAIRLQARWTQHVNSLLAAARSLDHKTTSALCFEDDNNMCPLPKLDPCMPHRVKPKIKGHTLFSEPIPACINKQVRQPKNNRTCRALSHALLVLIGVPCSEENNTSIPPNLTRPRD